MAHDKEFEHKAWYVADSVTFTPHSDKYRATLRFETREGVLVYVYLPDERGFLQEVSR